MMITLSAMFVTSTNVNILSNSIKEQQKMSGEDSSEEDDTSEEDASEGGEDEYRLNNVCFLHNLEDLQLWCSSQNTSIIRHVSFPRSLKKLTLRNTYLRWEDMKTKIGSLPVLQVLKLKKNSFIGSKWKTFEEQFLNLKLLLIEDCDVERWITHDAHFPRLEHLHLRYAERLREIPLCMGDISTLQTIMLEDCSNAVMDSAQKIKDEQQECGNEDLQISVA
ncbi:putative late blight resistance protein homolog R1A-4 [Salvia hispanica]|uniref:putative late blight resistance protein homolog R1A-4 n=1 Tax=Salvia hispanica TaxID=49212 RepID=UPI002009B5A2|nr:putative late blight resistance protein homolog R1A-4 [Salvia hispanica]